jgi:kynurenine formamidase
VHAFTHIDAPRHMVPEGPTTSELGLERVVGEAAVVDLSGIAPDTAIGPALLAEKGAHVRAGDIVLLKSCWDQVASLHAPEFWTTAPYMTREACTWLLDKSIKALGVDFPQDYPIRGLLTGQTAPISEFVTHDVLLRAGVILIEYLCNLGALETERTMLFALPLKLPEADGAPARVIAWEPDQG